MLIDPIIIMFYLVLTRILAQSTLSLPPFTFKALAVLLCAQTHF